MECPSPEVNRKTSQLGFLRKAVVSAGAAPGLSLSLTKYIGFNVFKKRGQREEILAEKSQAPSQVHVNSGVHAAHTQAACRGPRLGSGHGGQVGGSEGRKGTCAFCGSL